MEGVPPDSVCCAASISSAPSSCPWRESSLSFLALLDWNKTVSAVTCSEVPIDPSWPWSLHGLPIVGQHSCGPRPKPWDPFSSTRCRSHPISAKVHAPGSPFEPVGEEGHGIDQVGQRALQAAPAYAQVLGKTFRRQRAALGQQLAG